jgi:hypothetical protein
MRQEAESRYQNSCASEGKCEVAYLLQQPNDGSILGLSCVRPRLRSAPMTLSRYCRGVSTTTSLMFLTLFTIVFANCLLLRIT